MLKILESIIVLMCIRAAEWIRTGDHPPLIGHSSFTNMSGEPDSNRRPLPWEGSILPLNYHRTFFIP